MNFEEEYPTDDVSFQYIVSGGIWYWLCLNAGDVMGDVNLDHLVK